MRFCADFLLCLVSDNTQKATIPQKAIMPEERVLAVSVLSR